MANKYKVIENGVSLLTGDTIYQIANADDEVVDVGPYNKKEANSALKALQPKKVAKKVSKKKATKK
jgi:hypothetical protein